MPENNQNQEEPISPLKKLRIQAGLTQAELAKLIPDKTGSGTLSQRAVSAWERGEYQPELTIPQVKALCRALGLTLDELPDDFRPSSRLEAE
jgi:putative transcriptional regulator